MGTSYHTKQQIIPGGRGLCIQSLAKRRCTHTKILRVFNQEEKDITYSIAVFINRDAPTTELRFNVMHPASGHALQTKLNIILTNLGS